MDNFFISISRSELKTDEMIKLTNSKHCTVENGVGDMYLPWNDIQWKVVGNVSSYNESKRAMCKISDGIDNFMLSGNFSYKSMN